MSDRLYDLLPAIYRQRDAAQGQPLWALLAVMEEQLRAIEADIDRLYDNCFIETCDEWVVPYIADLLGIRGLGDAHSSVVSQRSRVANTIRYRRRKGTLATLEQVIRNATGWHVRAVEFFKLLGLTQSVNHVRPAQGRILDLRGASALEALGGPFETTAHMVDVRRRYNIPNIGLFICRHQSYRVTGSLACNITRSADGRRLPERSCYTFHPIGLDTPLFSRPQTKTGTSRALEGRHLPFPIGMEDFAKDLREYRDAQEEQRSPDSKYYGPHRSVNIRYYPEKSVQQNGETVLPIDIVCQSLRNWTPPPQGKKVAVDVHLGRMTFAEGEIPEQVEVSYQYGFSADIGGGPYDRRLTLAGPIKKAWTKTVSKQKRRSADFGGLKQMLIEWNKRDKSDAVITTMDNRTYEENLSIELTSGRRLVIQARDGSRPVLHGNLSVHGKGTLALSGLLIKGNLSVDEGVEALNLLHCTLIPKRDNSPSVDVSAENNCLRLTIDRCITGPLRLPADMTSLTVWDSIIDSRLGMQRVENGDAPIDNRKLPAVEAAGDQFGPLTVIERATVFGTVHVKELRLASDVIFTAPVEVENRQTGGVRYSFVPPGSRTPQRFRCQPDLEIARLVQEEKARTRAAGEKVLVPTFTSREYGQPGYAQLHFACPKQIMAGAADESEMGAFSHLKQPQREVNLRKVLAEFLPFGLEADIIYV